MDTLFIHIESLEKLKQQKLSINKDNTEYVQNNINVYGTPDILWKHIVFVDNEHVIWTHGKFYAEATDLSNLITDEVFAPESAAAYNSVQQGTLHTINGKSLENEDITLDLTLVRIVEKLPTTNIDDNKIYLVPNKSASGDNEFDEYIHVTPAEGDPFWELVDKFTDAVDLSEYIKKADADKLYMPKGTSSTSGSALSISTTGAFNNYGNNGQAFNAVRDLTGTSPAKYDQPTGSKFPLNAASFGVKDNGNTAFSHKKYTTFNPSTGAYSGAKNTAVLCFSGNAGLLYAKNTGSAADVTDDMYKFVGVIDSPDERQRCYSAKQVDDLLKSLTDRIEELEKQLAAQQNN